MGKDSESKTQQIFLLRERIRGVFFFLFFHSSQAKGGKERRKERNKSKKKKNLVKCTREKKRLNTRYNFRFSYNIEAHNLLKNSYSRKLVTDESQVRKEKKNRRKERKIYYSVLK